MSSNLGLDMVAICHYNKVMIKNTVRFPDDLRNAIVKSAEKNHRSLNGEIMRAVEFYLENAPEAKKEKETSKKKSSKSP